MNETRERKPMRILGLVLAATVTLPATAMADAAWFPYPAEETKPAFAPDGTRSPGPTRPCPRPTRPGTSAPRCLT